MIMYKFSQFRNKSTALEPAIHYMNLTSNSRKMNGKYKAHRLNNFFQENVAV